ncbi:hypothetical protein LXL04_016692 [Taraxacum kok-saghyz]
MVSLPWYAPPPPPNDGGAMVVTMLFMLPLLLLLQLLAVAPICAAFCNKAVAEVRGDDRVVPPSWREEGELFLGLPANRLPRPPCMMLRGINSDGFLESGMPPPPWLNSGEVMEMVGFIWWKMPCGEMNVNATCDRKGFDLLGYDEMMMMMMFIATHKNTSKKLENTYRTFKGQKSQRFQHTETFLKRLLNQRNENSLILSTKLSFFIFPALCTTSLRYRQTIHKVVQTTALITFLLFALIR